MNETTSTTSETTRTTGETTAAVSAAKAIPGGQKSCLVVIANPNGDPVLAELADSTLAVFADHSWNVNVIDLAGYSPAMPEDDRRAYHTDTPIVDPLVRQHADLVLSAHTLVFLYEVNWGTLPSLLKGWFDRTMVVGVALKLVNGRVRRNLTNVRQVFSVGISKERSASHKEFHDGGRRLMKRTFPIITHPRSRHTHLSFVSPGGSSDSDPVDIADSPQAQAFKIRALKGIAKMAQKAPGIPAPSPATPSPANQSSGQVAP